MPANVENSAVATGLEKVSFHFNPKERQCQRIWTEVRNTVQEVVTITILKKKKCKKANWLSEEALQIVEKRRDVKGKGEKKRYTYLNTEFQRIARRLKKA